MPQYLASTQGQLVALSGEPFAWLSTSPVLAGAALAQPYCAGSVSVDASSRSNRTSTLPECSAAKAVAAHLLCQRGYYRQSPSRPRRCTPTMGMGVGSSTPPRAPRPPSAVSDRPVPLEVCARPWRRSKHFSTALRIRALGLSVQCTHYHAANSNGSSKSSHTFLGPPCRAPTSTVMQQLSATKAKHTEAARGE